MDDARRITEIWRFAPFVCTIDTGVPIPPTMACRAQRPFRALAVGESFFVPGKTREQLGINRHHQRDGRRFATRRVIEDGIKGTRVWRIA